MSGTHLLTFLATVIVIVAIPGPSVLFTISRALTYGRRTALLGVVGNAVGCLLQVAAVSAGLGVLIVRAAEVVTVLRFAGAGYLIFLGVQAIRHRGRLAAALAGGIEPVRPLRALADGLLVGATNPKMIVFLIVFLIVALPQVTEPAAGIPLPVQMAVAGTLVPLVAVLMDSTWALAAGTVRGWFTRSPRRMSAIGGAGGLAVIGVGVSVAVTGRNG
ncbi:LysE family translocator [Microlunatus soli]|uniref:Threonine/homoserine/homoserine lactone efflux protein n=1 Tax=Microlunatus soli TaxID=630515 RepID=A0A1H1Z917_9ACTN|nr:LysE family translocator [Microlunatus soli]SDT30150.1 Threonine/homoserine/homoserine lactone efflux protein [Microlunatus soli]